MLHHFHLIFCGFIKYFSVLFVCPNVFYLDVGMNRYKRDSL